LGAKTCDEKQGLVGLQKACANKLERGDYFTMEKGSRTV
jgi:hypothetical protein